MHLAALVAQLVADALSIKTTEVALTSGQRMQWLSCEPPSQKTHLVCVHGRSTAWCFAKSGCLDLPSGTISRRIP